MCRKQMLIAAYWQRWNFMQVFLRVEKPTDQLHVVQSHNVSTCAPHGEGVFKCYEDSRVPPSAQNYRYIKTTELPASRSTQRKSCFRAFSYRVNEELVYPSSPMQTSQALKTWRWWSTHRTASRAVIRFFDCSSSLVSSAYYIHRCRGFHTNFNLCCSTLQL